MSLSHKPPAWLLSPAFLVALLVLLLNDLVLKQYTGNMITGKLSDFAGLFVFALFWTAILPRHRLFIHLATAVAFAWWKSPLSDGLIDAWNAWAPLTIGRVVDATDLIALPAIAASYWFTARPRAQLATPSLRWAIIPVALFAFGATTITSTVRYNRIYRFRVEPQQLRQGLQQLGINEWVPDDSTWLDLVDSIGVTNLLVHIPTAQHGTVFAHLALASDSIGSVVTLRRLNYPGTRQREDSAQMIGFFERCFVQRVDSLFTNGMAIRKPAIEEPGKRPPRWCFREGDN